MSIATKYSPTEHEDKWYAYWQKHRLFNSTPDEREAYTIVIPPPNVTGVLHMGHMLNNTIQDILIRRARMKGYNACWVPGTDHASIATEAKVVNKLKEEGIEKSDLTRQQFLNHAWDWTHKHGGIILEQLKKLGASCDWERTKFTMDADMSEAVLQVFVDLHKKGLIYRGVRMVNWDPKAQTAVSDEEVIHKEKMGALHHLEYKIDGEDRKVTIATTRPETILGDTAICVHPEDDRYKDLIGKKAIVPLVGRAIPIIADTYVDMEFGTGALKVTPAHDINDYELGLKHNLESIDIFDSHACINNLVGLYEGQDRFVCRKNIVKDLKELGCLTKVEDYPHKVGFSERTDAVIEPKLSLQWFCKMEEMAKPALKHVMNNDIAFHPEKFKNTYRHWMENVNDWCVSRQLWWGQRIPAWYYGSGPMDYVVSMEAEEALKLAIDKTGDTSLKITHLKQDEDVLDTWFSSWLWPISVFDGIRNPDNEEINYYYPTQDLVTAPEILFFWVARMIMAGYEYDKGLPFKNVYLTGIVRDKQGRKMSKSLGNSPDPIGLIEQYGADGVRVGMLLSSPAGNDLPFDESLCEQGRNFANKIWNAFRLVQGWTHDETLASEADKVAMAWFQARLSQVQEELETQYKSYRISEALMSVYKLIWDDFCSWYLEMVKPGFETAISKEVYDQSLNFFEELLAILHPFMPFISETIWQELAPRNEGDSLMMYQLKEPQAYDSQLLKGFDLCAQLITEIRKVRTRKQISFKVPVNLILSKSDENLMNFAGQIKKLANVANLEISASEVENAATFNVGTIAAAIPLEGNIDVAEETGRLEKEMEYLKGFLISVNKKLGNERFVAGAPEAVVAAEKKKRDDAEEKLASIEKQLSSLGNS